MTTKLTMKQTWSNNKSFTLIELLIAIALLGILATGTIMALNIGGLIGKGHIAKAKRFDESIQSGLLSNQVGKWSFDDQSNPGINTSLSGYGNDGTVNGATWQTKDQCGLGLGGCLSFDGVDDYVEISNSDSLNIGGNVTLSLWLYANSFNNNLADIYARYNGMNSGIVLEKNDGANSVSFYIGDGIDTIGASTSTLSTNRWYHIVATYGGTNIKIYVDSVLQDTQAQSPPATYIGIARIGWHSTVPENRRFWDGLIDEVAIYDKALTASQIQHLYAQGLIRRSIALRY